MWPSAVTEGAERNQPSSASAVSIGNWATGNHTATVTFLNDDWGGTATTDRNLYVDSAIYNGTAVVGATQTLLSAGPVTIGFADLSPVA